MSCYSHKLLPVPGRKEVWKRYIQIILILELLLALFKNLTGSSSACFNAQPSCNPCYQNKSFSSLSLAMICKKTLLIFKYLEGDNLDFTSTHI